MPTHISLRPLRVDDADAMSRVLADPALYEFTGGEPPTAQELRRLYTVQTRGGPADGSEEWLSLVVVLQPDEVPVGYVQATVPANDDPAEIAWVIGKPWQGKGYATRAAQLLVELLEQRGVRKLVAHIHPGNIASQHIATSLGMTPTDTVVDGETRWVR